MQAGNRAPARNTGQVEKCCTLRCVARMREALTLTELGGNWSAALVGAHVLEVDVEERLKAGALHLHHHLLSFYLGQVHLRSSSSPIGTARPLPPHPLRAAEVMQSKFRAARIRWRPARLLQARCERAAPPSVHHC